MINFQSHLGKFNRTSAIPTKHSENRDLKVLNDDYTYKFMDFSHRSIVHASISTKVVEKFVSVGIIG
jgi:hypothetical protein